MIYHNTIKLVVCYALLCCCGCYESELHQGKKDAIANNRKFKEGHQGLDSDDAHGMLEHSRELWQQRNLQEALKYARRAHKLNPNDPATRATIAGILLDAEKPAEAEKELRDLLAKNPSNADAHLLLAYTLSAQDMHSEAKEAFEHVLMLNCDSIQQISAHLGLGALLEKTGDIEGAAKHYQLAIAIDPQIKMVLTDVQKASLRSQAFVPQDSKEANSDEIEKRIQTIKKYLQAKE